MTTRVEQRASAGWLAGGGEMAERIRSFDWSTTPLGAPETWSPALRMMVPLLLANRFPMLLWWGPQYVGIYNDPYSPILGAKHPRALGQPTNECWTEIWHILQPLIDTPFHGGPATWNDDIELELHRHEFVEETHFAIAYSPVPDESVESGIGGVLATVHETTEKVVGERRVVALRDLGARAGEAKTAEEACGIVAQVLAAHAKDVPFALLYLFEPDGRHARLAASTGLAAEASGLPSLVELDRGAAWPWPVAEVLRTESLQVVGDLEQRFGGVGGALPPGPWSDPPREAVVVPVRSNVAHQLAGFMVAGVSVRLQLDELHRGFFELIAGQVATAIANAREFEAEKRRADALAEVDRQKTAFFSNVSHEFRTPLTLILGPLEDALAEGDAGWSRDRIELVHRNALRLQKLVNTLLDFSRIEAGRVRASYEATDLATLTAGLASLFRSAVEKAGMRLIVDSPPLAEPVHVDRDMIEKVVLNLLSNAFKFTLEGEIEVRLRDAGDAVELAIRDTGTGIAPEQLPHVFERFHRVEGARARSHEGTGIGLALVRELVHLHGGEVAVESVAGKGSTFTVRLPKGTEHLPADRLVPGIASAAPSAGTASYLEEALQWLPAAVSGSAVRSTTATAAARPRIVWADDNSDMRAYVAGLLAPLYEVEAVTDGEAALAAVRRRTPDLVLADVMMPVRDGFSLLRAIRADERTRTLPVILLSARAGEEARVEGMEAGADDYLVKPFPARELLARVEAHVKIARLRGESGEALRAKEMRLRSIIEQLPVGVGVLDRGGNWMLANSTMDRFHPGTTSAQPGATGRWSFRDQRGEPVPAAAWPVQRALRGEAVVPGMEGTCAHADGRTSWMRVTAAPLKGEAGEISGVIAVVQDITRDKEIEQALRDADRRKDEFLATLAHELRNPLAPIRNSLQILRLAGGPDPATARTHEMLARQVNHMVRLVDDLMEVSRISGGKVELRRENVDLAAVLRSAVETSQPLIDAARHLLEIDLAPEPLVLKADAVRLAQVVANLLNNAAKYTDDGGRIWLKARRDGADAVVSVRDSGMGIPAAMLPKIFDLFAQAEPSHQRAQGGLGIGLTLVRSLVEMHGGSVEARSDGPGRGSEFVVRLPLAAELARAATQDAASRGPEAVAPHRILVVDDNRDAGDSLAMLLRILGADVQVARDGSAALAAVESYRPDVMLLDIGMPGLDGHDVARAVRERPGGRDITLIALSGWGQEEDRRRSVEAGMDHHLVKPVDVGELERLLAVRRAGPPVPVTGRTSI